MTDLIRKSDALALFKMPYQLLAKAEVEALPAVTVGVKPLVWEGDGHWHSGDNEGWLEEANTPFGWGYAIEFGTTGQSPWVVSNTFGETLTGFDDPAAAKAAAQADYDARILAALTPNPVDASQAANPAVNAPDPAATVGVKALVWATDGRKLHMDQTMAFSKSYDWDGWDCFRQEGYGLGSSYIIWPDSIGSARWNLYGTVDGLFITDLNGESAAKAAAQSDYTARILAAMEPAAPDPAAIREAALRDALTLAANRLHRCSVDYDTGSREFIEVGEWATEARLALIAKGAAE